MLQVNVMEKLVVDARPLLPVSENSLWNKAAERRDGIASRIEARLEKLHLMGWVRKSQPGEYPLYIAVDVWRPVDESSLTGTFDRSFLKITIEVEPYREHSTIYTAELQRHNKQYTASYWQMPYDELDEMVTYLVQGGTKPVFFKSRIPGIVRILSTFIPLPTKEYENELIEEVKPNYLTWPVALGCAGVIVAVGGFVTIYIESQSPYGPDQSGVGLAFGLAGLVLMGTAWWLSSRRPVFQAIAKQPLQAPRREFIVDNWQVSVPEAGVDFASFQRRIHEALRMMDPEIEFSFETYQSRTPRGFESRERLVITKGQGNVHVHIQPFGRDAFVGWDSYLNWARWSETEPISTVVRDGKKILYRSLVAGAHVPSKFDLMELGALAETTHRVIVREIKAFLKEKEIEADLDFHIVRGDRSRALTEGKDETKTPAPKVGAL
jgi:hypothetical protein